MLKAGFFNGIAALCLTTALHGAASAPGNSISIGTLGVVRPARPFTISRLFRQGEILNFAQPRLDGIPIAVWQCDVMNRWPDGSLKHALISFSSIPGTVDFVEHSAGSSAGPPLNSAQMLDFDAGGGTASWGAEIEITAASTLSANVRTMLAAGAFTYWLRGPAATQVIVEDRSPALAFDLGWDANRSLHPIFVLTFYTGWKGVKVEYILENCWSTKLQDQTYSLALKNGPSIATTLYSRPSFNHYAAARWRKIFWNGSTPPAVRVDYNLPYMISTMALPNWDTARVVSAHGITEEVQTFNQGDHGDDFGEVSEFQPYLPTTGGRAEIGYTPRWNVRYLYTFDPRLFQVFSYNADVSGYVPVHVRESRNTATPFCGLTCSGSNSMVPAFGRVISIDARPTLWAGNWNYTWTSPADLISPTGPVTTGPWTYDAAHQADFAYLPYLILGDWYLLEELYFWNGYNLAASNPAANANYTRHNDWGFFNAQGLQQRGVAWALRTLAHAAFIAPDNTSEQAYFSGKLHNNIAIFEGVFHITQGSYPPVDATCAGYSADTTTDKWCWGFESANNGRANPLFTPSYDASGGGDPSIDPSTVSVTSSGWQDNFMRLTLGRIKEFGFADVIPIQTALSKNLIHILTDPAANPWLSDDYRYPALGASTGGYFQTWTSWFGAFMPANQTQITWFSTPPNDVEHGYAHIERAAASFLPGVNDGALSGQAAWDWVNAAAENVSPQAGLGAPGCSSNVVGLCDNPKWAILPRPGTAARCTVLEASDR